MSELYDDIHEYAKFLKETIKRDEEDILFRLKESGKRLKELLNITEEDIDRAIREFRREG